MCQVTNTVILIVYHQSDSLKSGFRSTWEQLLNSHTTLVAQSDSDRTSHGPTPTTATGATSSFPSPPLRHHHDRTNQRSRANDRLQSREFYRPASSSTQASKGAFGQGNRRRPVMPSLHQEPSTSSSALKTGGGTGSTGFTTSAFSFQVPSRTSYPVHGRMSSSVHGRTSHPIRGASQDDNNAHPIPTGYHSDHRGFAPSVPPLTQVSAQTNEAQPRSSRCRLSSQWPRSSPTLREIDYWQFFVFGKHEQIRRYPQGI